MTLPHGISNNVEGWLVANINGATAPFAYTQIAGGHSNLTFKVDDAAGHSYVLRRPPLGHRLASAHDMGREHRIIAGLANSNVPVATARGLCTEEAVNELPFYVMDFVDGHVVRDKATAETILGPDGCKRASESIVDTMAAIHAVDLKSVGLDDLGRHDGFISRQLKRWHGNIVEQRTRELPLVDSVFEELMLRIPEQASTTIVHGDYRLGNIMVNDNGLTAILDWELAHIGDPMEDLGWLCVRAWRFGGAFPAAGLGTYDELFDAYTSVTGVRPDPDVVRWWEILGTLKWGIICISQAATHLMGIARSHELAAIGRRVCENEYDLIELLTERTQ